jgi:Rps23 Pro-64 3,4-dihydroxylase Tpa1-like proline 4-hydroxylase
VQSTGDSRVIDALLSAPFPGELEALARSRADEYRANTPFPHIYFDNFLPPDVAEAVLRHFPEPEQADWYAYKDLNQRNKLALEAVEKLPGPIRDVFYFLNSRPMLRFLESLTGIHSLLPDPYYTGGGLHQIGPGGSLGIHADFSYHHQLRLDRRINVLIYLNKDWKEDYRGHLELWDREVRAAEKKILPVFNRCAVFSTSSVSFHGHPEPLACPAGETRKSLAAYYYSNGRPEENPELTHRHEVAFRARPGLDSGKMTIGVKRAMRAITPPILTELYRRITRKGLAAS